MIGPGTGFAPFRAFIQERDLAVKEGYSSIEYFLILRTEKSTLFDIQFILITTGKPVGETILYYGCRKKTEDYIYEEELNEYEKNGSLKVFISHILTNWKNSVFNVLIDIIFIRYIMLFRGIKSKNYTSLIY